MHMYLASEIFCLSGHLLPKLKLFSETPGQERGQKLMRLTCPLNITVKVIFEFAYTVTVNTINETIDILEENSW